MLSENEKRGYRVAILIGAALNPSYIFRLSKKNILDCSEFSKTENAVDKLAEWPADFIVTTEYKAYAQSERKLVNGFFNVDTKTTPLPHNKIAMLAGLGWIGKNNLLINIKLEGN
jgi:epoxyqueuosine reductase QueG